MSFVENIDKVHEQLIQEEGISVSQLPDAVQRKIKGWNLLMSRLEKNPEDEKLFRTLQKQSVEIADKIQDFIENDFNEEGDDDGDDDGDNGGNGDGDNTPNPKKEPKQNTSSNNGDNNAPIKEPTPNQPKRFGNLVMEKKILDVLKNNGGRISINALESIIGKEPDYPEQEVHTIRLRKVFMASDYRLL